MPRKMIKQDERYHDEKKHKHGELYYSHLCISFLLLICSRES